MVDCKESKQRFRADQLFFAPVVVQPRKIRDTVETTLPSEGESPTLIENKIELIFGPSTVIGYVSALESENTLGELTSKAQELKRKLGVQGEMLNLVMSDFTQVKPEEVEKIPSPATGKPGSLTPPRDFNLMFSTHVGAVRDDSSVAYLRPETAPVSYTHLDSVTSRSPTNSRLAASQSDFDTSCAVRPCASASSTARSRTILRVARPSKSSVRENSVGGFIFMEVKALSFGCLLYTSWLQSGFLRRLAV